jgi:uncharacterized membrane protein YgcG
MSRCPFLLAYKAVVMSQPDRYLPAVLAVLALLLLKLAAIVYSSSSSGSGSGSGSSSSSSSSKANHSGRTV